MSLIAEHRDELLSECSKDAFYEDMKKAHEVFVLKTGKLDEDAEEYEARMSSFNDWFLFNYTDETGSRIIDKYLDKTKSDNELLKSFSEANYSLFHFVKINFRKQIIIKDILHNVKFVLAKDSGPLPLVQDDLFVGRSIFYSQKHYLLDGICLLPRNVLSVLKKESKKIRKLEDVKAEEEFLLNIEALRNKALQYGHIDSQKLFKFANS